MVHDDSADAGALVAIAIPTNAAATTTLLISNLLGST
jgi:hypothetical protein